MEAFKLGHVKVMSGDLAAIVAEVRHSILKGDQRTCIPLNLSKYVMSQGDPKLARAINGADLVIADGIAIKWLARRIGYASVHRVTGVELAEQLLAQARSESWRVYLLGSKPENLKLAVQAIAQQFGTSQIVGYRDGYFAPADVPNVINDINATRADILLLGLGLPQKEYFMADHFSKLNVHFCVAVGGAIDIWAGAKSRAPLFVQKVGLEWIYRSMYDLSRAGLIMRYGLRFLKDLAIPPS